MKTMRFLLLIIISLIIYSTTANAQLEFVQHAVASDFTNGFDVIAEDLDQDGHPDIIGCAKTNIGEVSWWKNNGLNGFDKIVIKQGFQGARSVRAKDMDDDQDIDLVSAAWQANTIIFFENDGNENFTEHIVDDDFKGAHTIDLKDVNHDGLIDILCSGFDYYGHEGEIAWWKNDGLTPIGWTKNLISDRFQQSPFIYGEDMDNDEDLDVIACGELNDEILWWENNGSGDFIGEYMIDSLFDAAHTVIARDVDMDGDMDILGAACLSSSIAWYENDGSQQFLKHPLPQFGGALWLDAIDVDNDNDMDLFGAGMTENRLAWWENNGSQFFAKHYIDNTFTQGFSIVPVHMDNDNDIDFAAIGYTSDKISWFENKLVDPLVYNHPECCVFDYDHNRWLISNTGGISDPGYILEVDENGALHLFKDGINDPYGMCIAESTLYVSDGTNGVYGFDLESGNETFFMDFSPVGNVDGQTYDNDGHLFIVDTGGKIYKIYLSNQTVTEFVSSGLTSWTQDIVFDEGNNRLLAIGYGNNAPIQAISLEDSTITNYPTNFSSYDGITIDQFGNVYLASHQSPGRIVKYKNGLSGDYDIVSFGHDEPAGIHYNIESNILAIPNYGGSTVDFIYAGGNLINVPEDEATIQTAINIALNSDTILVAPGTYIENIDFLGKNIVVASQYIIDHNFTHIQNTIIDGSNPAYPDTACCVRFVSGEESSAALIGFTICNGTGTQWVDPQIPTWTWHSGGGIFIFQSSPTIKCNIITNNHVNDPMSADGASGGGICTYGRNPIIQNNIIKNNTALYGAGVVIDYSGCIFRNNIVTENSGGQSYGGGAFWIIGNGTDPILIENNTIVNNEVIEDGLGGAMYLWSTNLTAVNNIIWGNIQPTGDPIYLTGGSSIEITYSNMEGGYDGEGNINQSPLFADTNFLLLQNSPCIDAGNPEQAYNDNENPTNPNNALWPSFGSLVNDMGVYGGQNCIFLGNTSVGFKENFKKNNKNIFEINCFPNPFQEYVNINITADKKSDIEIKIFSIDGKLIKCINKQLNSESDNYITWDGKETSGKVIANGMYFIKMTANDKLFTQKIVKQ